MSEGVAVFCVLALPVLVLVLYISYFTVASYCVYTALLRRKNKDVWGRGVSSDDIRQKAMYDTGLVWAKENADKKIDVHIKRAGLNLYGEYYDLGYSRAVMILPGRAESLEYGYYFAKPYAENGCNVLVVDPRAHGMSDGEFNTVGFEESKDALAWAKYIHEYYGAKSVIFHGVCIGAAGAMLAITDQRCPDYIEGLVTEGMFANFYESMRNHLIERKKLIFPILQAIDFWMKHYTGHSMTKGPIDCIETLNKPILMLQSKEDRYSTAKLANKMFKLCPCAEKNLVLFEKGEHSMLRITDTEKYDSEIASYLIKAFSLRPQPVCSVPSQAK